MKPARVPELDLLRFVAASAVVAYHYTYRPLDHGVVNEEMFGWTHEISRFGYLGVTLFFLISGFVILWTATEKNAVQFVVSRATRLFPSFWVAVLVTTAVVVALAPRPEWPSLTTVLLNLTMLPGYLRAEFIDGVYWTLAVEIKFYVIIFLLVLFRQLRFIATWYFLWLAGLTACYFLEPLAWLRSLTMYPHGPLFIGGGWLYLVYSQGFRWSNAIGLAWAMALSVAMAGSSAQGFITAATANDILVSQLLVVCFYGVFLVVATRTFQLTPYAWITALGALTYPLYLVHNRIGKLIAAAVEDTLPPVASLLLLVVVAYSLAWLLSEFIERRAVRAIHQLGWIRKLSRR